MTRPIAALLTVCIWTGAAAAAEPAPRRDAQGNFYFGSERAGTKGKDDVFVVNVLAEEPASPVSLSAPVNTAAHEGCPYVAPDGRYLLFCRDGIQVSYREEDGSWSEPKSLGEGFAKGICPYVSPDDKYLFYLVMGMGFNDVWWVDASVIPER